MMDAERKAEIRTRCDPSQRQPCRAYLEDVPDLLAAIDELEVRNAKLEALAKAAGNLNVRCHNRSRPSRDCWLCKLRTALDALNHQ